MSHLQRISPAGPCVVLPRGTEKGRHRLSGPGRPWLALLLAPIFFALLTPALSRAADSDNASRFEPSRFEPSRFEQRQLYRTAIVAARKARRSQFQALRSQLTDYPLLPYLDYNERVYNLARQDSAEIRAFIEQWRDTPLANRLRQNWLYFLAKRDRWRDFIAFYEDDNANNEIACFYGYALYQTDQQEAAFAAAERLWLTGYSQPKECDPVFRVWRNADRLTDNLAWQRFALAMANDEISLANYLQRYLGDADKALARDYLQAYRQPAQLPELASLNADTGRHRQIVGHGLRRLARRDAEGALNAFTSFQQDLSFSPTEIDDLYGYIGIRLSWGDNARTRLAALPVTLAGQQDLLEARIRLALQHLDWGQVLVLINLLDEDLQTSPRWQYWKARVLMNSSDPADQAAARQIYGELAELRDFYGFMAADVLGRDYNFVDQPSPVDRDDVQALALAPGMQRAFELYALNEVTQARREWSFTTADFTAREQQIAAHLGHSWGLYRQGIQGMINARYWNDLAIRFPLAHTEDFVSSARSADISLFWSMAIARQESAFMPDARSSAGAMGLMQLMPATARQTAQRHGIALDSSRELIDPRLNIRLGTAYLGGLYRRFDNNRILASAAYNAGPSRLKDWLNPDLPLDVWIEVIPFRETRGYVQNVLMYACIYAHRMNQPQPLIYPSEWTAFAADSEPITQTVALP